MGAETMHRILRTYYDRWKLKHVDEEAFREVAEEVSGMDLTGFFAQWLHSTDLVDYSVGRVTRRRLDGRRMVGWTTIPNDPSARRTAEYLVHQGGSGAEVAGEDSGRGLGHRPERYGGGTFDRPGGAGMGDGRDPKRAEGGIARSSGARPGLGHDEQPEEVRLPSLGRAGLRSVSRHLLLDPGPPGRAQQSGFSRPSGTTTPAGSPSVSARAATTSGGLSRIQFLVSGGTGWATDEDVLDLDEFVRLRNPVWLRSPGMTQTLDVFNVEGRYGAVLSVERTHRPHLSFGPEREVGLRLRWVVPDDARFLVPGEYEDVGTAELELSAGVRDRRGPWQLGLKGTAGAGWSHNSRGLANATGRNDLDPYFYRATAGRNGRPDPQPSLASRLARLRRGERGRRRRKRPSSARSTPRAPTRWNESPIRFCDRGRALLLRPDVYYHMAGGGDLRGYDPTVSMSALVAANLELERTVLDRGREEAVQAGESRRIR